LPSVLGPDEVARLLAALFDDRYRLLVQTAYACGLRLSEVLHLRLGDIDSRRWVLHVRQAKGRQDRLVPLPAGLLGAMRAYWRRYRPSDWLFPGHKPGQPLHPGSVQRLFQRVVQGCGFGRRVSFHTLRETLS
jgi:integrase